MYSEKLVAVIKVGGKVLRETNGTVYIPFGREYTIQLKNLNSVKAVVSIDIDGDNVTDGSRYIVHPNQTIEIEGFLKGDDITRKFKFLEKTQEISDFRGDDMEDGLVKLEYQFEFDWNRYSNNYWETYNGGFRGIVGGSGSSGDYSGGPRYGSSVKLDSSNINCCVDSTSRGVSKSFTGNVNVASAAVPQNDNGITGRGSESNQSFQKGSVGFLDPKMHTMVIQLKGDTGDKYVEAPIYTRTRLQCDMCGKRWPSSQEYCGGCSNSLR
jgi:hypothetical protein